MKNPASEIRQEGASRRFAASVLAPRSLIWSLTSARLNAILLFAALTAALALFSGVAGVSTELYYLRPDPSLFATLAELLASLATLLVVGYASARYVFKSSVDVASLAASSSVSFLPVLAVSALTVVPQASAALAASPMAYTLLLVLSQTWSSAIFGAGLSVASGVRIERTLLVSLVVLYATMVVMLVQGIRI